uniref:Uncharacterized protein n=1 Tax=Rhizophora mucronata TaxID=61149 RepID=A0A2P2MJ35_RHIMU
MSGVRIRLEGF